VTDINAIELASLLTEAGRNRPCLICTQHDLVAHLAIAIGVVMAERDEALIGVEAVQMIRTELNAACGRLEAQVAELEAALADACDVFDECTGDYAKELAADDLARWRALVSPAKT
jgi:hypothetical protein